MTAGVPSAARTGRAPETLRVAQVTATFPPYLGGAGTTCLHFARGLAARGHDVEVFTAPADGPVPDTGAAALTRLRPLLRVGNAPLLPGLARLRGFDVVHLHHPFIFGTEITLLGRLRPPRPALVVSYHNRLVGEGRRMALFDAWERSIGRALLESADRVCVLSRGHAGSVPTLRSLERRHPERLAVVPNGVDVELFRPGPDEHGVRLAHGIPDEAVVVAFVATLDRAHYFKRLDLALGALRRARDPRLHLLVVGGGEELEHHRSEAARMGLAERVHFAGPAGHDRLPALLRAADLLVLCSDPPESFGIVLIEAMATGLPTVSTDLPGVSEVGVPGETGLVVPRGDRERLAAALDAVAGLGVEGRTAMGRAGRALCERRYAWPELIGPLEDVYRAALERRRATTGRHGAVPA